MVCAPLLLGGTSELGNSGYLRVYRVEADGSLMPAPAQSTMNGSDFAYGNPDTVLVSPNGKYAYVSSTEGLAEYTVQPDGSLEEVDILPGPISYPVMSRGGSLIFALRRMPGTEHSPGFSSLLMAIRVDKLGHMTHTTYLISADGSLQEGGKPGKDWGNLGFAYNLCPSADGKRLYAINPSNHEGIYSFSVDPTGTKLELTQKIVLPDDPKSGGYPAAMTVISASK